MRPSVFRSRPLRKPASVLRQESHQTTAQELRKYANRIYLAIVLLFVSGAGLAYLAIEAAAGQKRLVFMAAAVIIGLLTATAIILLATISSKIREKLLEQERLTAALEDEKNQLDIQLHDRRGDLERRLNQMRAVAEISRTISQTLDLDRLLPQICERLVESFHLYYAGIFLVDEGDETGEQCYARLAAGSGDAGRRMLADNHKLLVGGESMIGWATANRKPRIALDVGVEAVRFNNPYLPDTRSEMALPILGQPMALADAEPAGLADNGSSRTGKDQNTDEQVLGAITIQSSEASAFDEDDITVLQGIANSLASAIQNTRLFNQLQANLEEIRRLHNAYLGKAWQDTVETAGRLAYTYARPGIGAAPAETQGRILNNAEVNSRPATPTPSGQAAEIPNLRRLKLPLKVRQQVIGNLVIEADPLPGAGAESATTWSAEELAFIEAVTNQAALALENARLLQDTLRSAEQERLATHISNLLWSSANIDDMLRTTLLELSRALNASSGMIRLELDEKL